MIQATPEMMFVQRALNDTGFFCRHVLGWNYDLDEETGKVNNPGTGGVRAEGPHLEMTNFLDREGGKRWKHLEDLHGILDSRRQRNGISTDHDRRGWVQPQPQWHRHLRLRCRWPSRSFCNAAV